MAEKKNSTPKKRKRGRPKSTTPNLTARAFRATDEQWERWEAAAEAAGCDSRLEWMRGALDAAAHKAMR